MDLEDFPIVTVSAAPGQAGRTKNEEKILREQGERVCNGRANIAMNQ
jgi:hypothetical protein